MEQLTIEIVSCFANGSAPTENEPLKTLKTIVGISNQTLAPL
jgi:hypothetical protein